MKPVKVMVGVPSGDTVCLPFNLSFPLAVKTDLAQTDLYSVRGMNTVSARNKIVHAALKDRFDYVFFMDSDMEFPPETLSRLLNHKKDIVGGFYLRKKGGFLPNAFKLGFTAKKKLLTEFITDFREVEAIGTGCLLIKTSVFRKVGKPWFEYETIKDSPDQHMATEDIVFCRNAKKVGYRIYCDGGIPCGHIGSFVVTPVVFKGQKQARIEPV